MSKLTNLAVGLLLAFSLVLTGCEEVKCESCDGEDCTAFLGEYYGTLESLSETCADVILVPGDQYLNVTSSSPLVYEFRDSRGMWAIFNGNLCATNDEEDPMTYFFTSYHVPDTTGKEYKLDYSLIGFFTAGYAEEETAYPASVTATLDLRVIFDDGEICTLTGDVRLTQSL